MNKLIEKIKSAAREQLPEIITIRRHLHSNPELSFQEFETSAFICTQLKKIGIPYTSGIVKTGIIAFIEGKNPQKKTVALRADMDALPITEKSEKSYCSKNVGVMHACGHDVHTASLLGAAKILFALRDEFEGTLKLIFQPGEEKLPGGASLMIAEGVLEDPKPDAMFGQHVYPSMEAGKVGFRKGMYMASTDELYLTVKGKGGHAAMPEDYNSPLLIASEILLALDKEFMQVQNKIPTVLAFGKMIAEGATNVIPDTVRLEGTFRTMDEPWRAQCKMRLKEIAAEIAAAKGGSAELNILDGYPFLVNDEGVTQRAINAATEYVGKENVEELPIRMTAEDFAFYSQQIPSCFYRLGTGNKQKGIISGVHTSTFDIDESALETGAGLMAYLAIRELSE